MTMQITTLGPRRRGPGGWLVLAVVLLAIGLALYLALDQGLAAWGDLPVRIVIDGEEVVRDIHLGSLSEGQKVAMVAAALGVTLLCALVVPLLMLMVLLLIGGVLLFALGLPLLVLAAMLAVVGSPLLLVVALLIWLLRRSSTPRHHATIAR